MKRTFSISIVMLVLTACSTSMPRFINHDKPDFSLDVAAFGQTGCPTDQYSFRECQKDSPLYALGCDEIREPPSILGALKPTYPIMLCVTSRDHILFDQISPIDKALEENCATSPDKVCFLQTDFISETVQANCDRTHSLVCDFYREALQEKCRNAPAKVCDPLAGPYQMTKEVEEKVLNVEHIALGDYAYQSEGNYFFRNGGLKSVLFRYVIFQDNQFILLKNEKGFRKIFAPLETGDEALAYVRAVTGLDAVYDLRFDSHYEYFTDVIEDTHATKVADGYWVYLYTEEVFGCGPHLTYQVTFRVTLEGIIQQQEVKQVFKDRSEDGLCVD